MSQTIDSKVVEMSFDNKQFEKNVSTSISSIDKLKKSLNFDGVTKGFDELGKSTSSLNLSGVSTAVDTVKLKFSALQIAAIQVLSRITDAAYDAGVALVKNLSVDNIATGWSKFEQKTQSVGTLIAQGYDMSTVETQLSKLAWFTDETSYEFTQMVESIAKFTAAGKSLPDSVEALMGIANWAALSGQNAQTASRAMYQISQAMGAGVMRKEDYKSIQNVSMDTVEFRQAALDAGVALGTLKKNADGTYKSIAKGGKKSTFTISQFAEHLTQEAWFTSDVMMKVFESYSSAVDKIYNYQESQKAIGNYITASQAIDELSGDLEEFELKAFRAAQEARTWTDTVGSVKEAVASTWMETFEIIFGNYDEAKDFWTDLANELYDIFAEPGNERNNKLFEGLKSSKPYLDKIFKDTYNLSDTAAKSIHYLGEQYGWSSKELDDYIEEISHGDKVMENVLKGYYRMQNGVKQTTDSIRISSDELYNYASRLSKVNKEQIQNLDETGKKYGYNSKQFNKLLKKMYGSDTKTKEMVRNILKVGKGIDEIKAKDVENYLKKTNKLTDDQIEHLKEIRLTSKDAATDMDEYLKSLGKYNSKTRKSIIGVLGILDELPDAKELDTSEYIKSISGGKDKDIKELEKFTKARDNAKESVDGYITSLSNENKWTEANLRDYIDSHKEKGLEAKEIAKITGGTEKQAQTLINLIETEDGYGKELDKIIKKISNGNEETEETIRTILDLDKKIDDLSGRSNLVHAFWGFFRYGVDVINAVKDAFNEVFSGEGAQGIYDFTQRLRDFAEKLTLDEETAEKLKRIFKGIFSIFKIIGQAIKPIIIPIRDLFGMFAGSSGDIMESLASIGDWISGVADSGVVAEKATKFFTKVSEVMQKVVPILVDFVKGFFDINKIAESFTKGNGGISGVFQVIYDKIKDVLGLVFDLIEAVTGFDMTEIKNKVFKFLDSISEKIKNWLPDGEKTTGFFTKILDFFKKITGVSDVDENGDKLTVFGTIKEIIKKLGEVILKFGGAIIDFFAGLKEPIHSVGEFIGKFGKGIANFFTDLFKSFENTSSQDIKDIARALSAIALALAAWYAVWELSSFADVPDSFSDWMYAKATSSYIQAFAKGILILSAALAILAYIPKEKLTSAMSVLSGLAAMMVGVFEIMEHTGSKETSSFKSFFGSDKGSGLLKFAASILLLAISLKKISEIPEKDLKRAGHIISLIAIALGLSELLIGSGSAGAEFVGSLSSLILVGSIILLANKIIELSKVAKENDITEAAGIVISIGLMLAVVEAVFGKTGNAGGVLLGVISSVILTGAIIALVTAVMIISKIANQNKVTSAAGIVLAIGIMFAIVGKVFGSVGNWGSMIAGAASMLILALAIQTVVATIMGVSLIGDPSQLISTATAIGIIVTALGIFLALMSIAQPQKILAASGAFAIASAALTNIAIAVALMAGSMALLNSLGDNFWPALGKMAALLGVIVGIGLVGTIAAKGLLAVAKALMMMASIVAIVGVGLMAIGVGIGLIGRGITKAATGIALLYSSLSLFTKGKGIGKVIRETLSAFIEMAPEIGTGLANAIGGFAESITENAPKIREAFKQMIALGLGIITDSLPIIRSSLVEILKFVIGIICDSLIESTSQLGETAVSIIIGILDILIARGEELTNKLLTLLEILLQGVADHTEGLVDKVMQILINLINGVTGRIPELVDSIVTFWETLFNSVFDRLKNLNIDIEDLSEVVDGLVKIIEILGLLTAINLMIPTAMTGVLGIASVIAEIEILLWALVGIAEILHLDDISGFSPADFEGYVSIMNSITTIMVLLSAMNLLTATAITGALGVASVVAVLIPLLALLGAIKQIPGIDFLVGEGGDLLEKVGKALGRFIAPLIEGAITGVINTLPAFGKALTSFMENAQGFISSASAIDESVVSGVENFFKAVALMTVSEIVSFIGDILTLGSIGDAMFKDNLVEFAKAMTAFSNEISKADLDALNSSAQPIKDVMDAMNAIYAGQTIIGWLIKQTSFSLFAENLKGFGQGMADFAEEISGKDFDSEKVESLVKVAKKLADLQKALEPMGGVADWFLGEKDIGKFGDSAKQFADRMSSFIGSVKKMDLSEEAINKIDSLKSIADKLVSLQKSLEGYGGIIKGLITGMDDLGTFGLTAVDFANSMKDFLKTISSLNITENNNAQIDSLISISEKLRDLQKSLDGVGGLIKGLITGMDDLASFGLTVQDWAKSMKDMFTTLKDLPTDTTSIDTAITIAGRLSDLQKGIDSTGFLKGLVSGTNDLGNFGKQIKNFGAGLVSFANEFKRVDESNLKKSTDITEAIAKLTYGLPKDSKEYAIIKTALGELSGMIKGFIDTWTSMGDGGFEKFKMEAELFTQGLKTILGADYSESGSLAQATQVIDSIVNKVLEILYGGKLNAGEAGKETMDNYGESAAGESEYVGQLYTDTINNVGMTAEQAAIAQKLKIDSSISAWGVDSIDYLIKNGGSINDAITLWGKDGIANLSSSDLLTLFKKVPKDWIDALKNGSTNKSPELLNLLEKIAKDGTKKLTSGDIMTLYKEGGMDLIESVIGGSESKRKKINEKIKELVKNGVNNGNLDNDTLQLYFKTGGKLDDKLIEGIKSQDLDISDIIKKVTKEGSKPLSEAEVQKLYEYGGAGLVEQVMSGYESKKTNVKDSVLGLIKTAINDGVVPNDLAKLYEKVGGSLDDSMSGGILKNKDSVTKAGKNIANDLGGLTDLFNDKGTADGGDFSSGVAKGIEDKTSKVTKAAKKLAEKANKAFKDELDIESPSKVMAESGEWFVEGFIVGLESMSRSIEIASGDSAKEAVDGFMDVLNDLSSVNLNDIGDALTIRPVMDLTDVQNGVNQIDSMMNGVNGYAVSGTLGMAGELANSIGTLGNVNPESTSLDKLADSMKNLAAQQPKQITNNFTIQSNDPEEVYEYISSRLQTDYEREDVVWA